MNHTYEMDDDFILWCKKTYCLTVWQKREGDANTDSFKANKTFTFALMSTAGQWWWWWWGGDILLCTFIITISHQIILMKIK